MSDTDTAVTAPVVTVTEATPRKTEAKPTRQYKTPAELARLPILPPSKSAVLYKGDVMRCAKHPNARIRILGGNPKKPGSAAHDIWGLYRDGMTVAAFLALPNIQGGKARARADLDWNYAHGYLTLDI